MSQFARRHDWDARRRRHTMDDMHWPRCKTNCMAPRIGKSDACLDGHTEHTCNCDDVARAHGESIAEAFAEHLDELTRTHYGSHAG